MCSSDLELLYRVAKADSLGRNADWVPREKWFNAKAQDWFIERAKQLEVDRGAPAPLLMGRHLLELGMEPGPAMGEVAQKIYELQLDGEITSLEDAKAAARQMLSADYTDYAD